MRAEFSCCRAQLFLPAVVGRPTGTSFVHVVGQRATLHPRLLLPVTQVKNHTLVSARNKAVRTAPAHGILCSKDVYRRPVTESCASLNFSSQLQEKAQRYGRDTRVAVDRSDTHLHSGAAGVGQLHA